VDACRISESGFFFGRLSGVTASVASSGVATFFAAEAPRGRALGGASRVSTAATACGAAALCSTNSLSWLVSRNRVTRLTEDWSRMMASMSSLEACSRVGPNTVAMLSLPILFTSACLDTAFKKGNRTLSTAECSGGILFARMSRATRILASSPASLSIASQAL